jgi:hypothetical protein
MTLLHDIQNKNIEKHNKQKKTNKNKMQKIG